MITLVGRVALGGALVALAPLTSAAQQTAQSSSGSSQAESTACTCTCTACQEKHGPKAEKASQGVAPEIVELGALVQEAEALRAAPELELDLAWGVAAPAQERGFLGVYLGDDADGAVIASVIDGSAAARGKLRAGDRIVGAEELPVRTSEDLLAVLAKTKPGDVITLEVERGDDEMRLTIELGARSTESPAVPAPPVRLRPADPDQRRQPVQPRQPAPPRRPSAGTNAADAPSSGFFLLEAPDAEEPVIVDFEVAEQEIGVDAVAIEEPPVVWKLELSTSGDEERPEPTSGFYFSTTETASGARDLVGDGSVLLMPDGSVVVKPRPAANARSAERTAKLEAEIARLEAQVAELTAIVQQMKRDLADRRRRR